MLVMTDHFVTAVLEDGSTAKAMVSAAREQPDGETLVDLWVVPTPDNGGRILQGVVLLAVKPVDDDEIDEKVGDRVHYAYPYDDVPTKTPKKSARAKAVK